MNKFIDSHFAGVPTIRHPRSRMDLSHGHKLTANVGELVPIYVDPYILPGTTVSMDTSKVIRFQTMMTPVMDNLDCSIFWFFVPYRLVWDHFVNMMGENTSSPWITAPNYPVPKLKVAAHGATVASTHTSCNDVGSLLDYFGYPVEMTQSGDNAVQKINALPFRAYAKIVNDWFISEAVTDPVNLYTGDSDQDAYDDGGANGYIEGCARGGKPFVACKHFDLFTGALPQPQKGPTVTLPLGTLAPVVDGEAHDMGNNVGMTFKRVTGSFATDNSMVGLSIYQASDAAYAYLSDSGGTPIADGTVQPNNLWADLSEATAASINQLRFAFQLQKFYERIARGGSRYTELISSFYNLRNPDARLQRSEYLGGNRFQITVDQVLNTAQSSGEYLGDLGAYSCTPNVHSDFTKSFSEHGCLIGLMCVRVSNRSYSQGLQPWMKFEDRLSWYWPTFDSLGEVGIDKNELYLGASGTFGYQEAWYPWRHRPSRVSGEFRPYISGSLGSWHYGDDYDSAPSLSDTWMREDKANVDRTLTVTSATSNQFWADFWFKAWYTQPMSMYSVPGLIDHF